MLISTATPWIRGQLYGRLSTPHAHLSRIQVQLVREANGKSGRVIIESIGRPPDVEAQFLRRHANALYRVIQRGHNGALDPVLETVGGSEESRSDDGWIIAGNVGNKERMRRAVAQKSGNAAALDSG